MDQRSFVKQLTQIERQQVRIRWIGDRLSHCSHIKINELARNLHVHHHIGIMQKYPIHIGSYLCSHQGDLALKVSSIVLLQTLSHICRILCQNSRTIYCVASLSPRIRR
jgi:hypothetical protein